MIVARSHLFDNWQIGNSILVMFAGFRAVGRWPWAALLNYGAEGARRAKAVATHAGGPAVAKKAPGPRIRPGWPSSSRA